MSHPLDTKIKTALSAIDSFTVVLDKEAAALRTSDYKTFSSLQEKKKELAHAYQDSVLAFEEHIDALKTLDQPRKNLLEKAYERFNESVKNNENALVVAKRVSERLVNLIMTAAKQTVMDGPSYNAAGNQALSDKVPVHFRLNEKF